VQSNELLQTQPAKAVIGEQVSRVDLSGDFPEVNAPCADRLLDPQRVGIQVA
jgi:hypothetical protein